VPQTAQQLINRYAGDKRTIDYLVINSTSVPAVAEPTEDDLKTYLAAHQADYRTVETRNVDLLAFSPDTLAATKTITDEQIAAEYERTKANLVKPERRTIRQLVLPNDAAVTAFETGKAAGKTFDQLATEANLTPTDLGTLSAAQVTDAALSAAAFKLAQGDSIIIDGAMGKRAITVTAIEPGGEITLADARDTIAKNLALTQAKTEYADVLDQIEELRASFKPLSEIATRFNIPLNTVSITATGAELASIPAITQENQAKVATAIFAAQADKLEPTVQLGANNNVWFDLKSIEAARDKTLDEVRDAVRTAWIDEKTNAEIVAKVDTIVGKLKAGTPFADVASSEDQFPQLSQPLTRAGDGTPILNAAVANAAFDGGADHFGSAVNGDGDHVVFHVVDVQPATETADEKTRQYVEQSVRDDLYGEFLTGLRDDAGLRTNAQAITQAVSVMTAGN
jgi:peptidyl-prolyl cis-trans isomerase D